MKAKAGATGGRSNRLRTLSGELSKTQVYNKTTAKARAQAQAAKGERSLKRKPAAKKK